MTPEFDSAPGPCLTEQSMRVALLHQMIHWLQVVTEMVLGFDRSFATPELLARQEALFTALHGGLAALPINLPGTGDLHQHATSCCNNA